MVRTDEVDTFGSVLAEEVLTLGVRLDLDCTEVLDVLATEMGSEIWETLSSGDDDGDKLGVVEGIEGAWLVFTLRI